jgi:hypothetical protein
MTGNIGKWWETIRKRRSMACVIPLLSPQPGVASVRVPLKPGCKAAPELNQDGKRDRNHGLALFSDTHARQRVEEEQRRPPADPEPKRKKHSGRDNEGLRDRWEDLELGWVDDIEVHGAVSCEGNEALLFDQAGSWIHFLVVLLARTPILGANTSAPKAQA